LAKVTIYTGSETETYTLSQYYSPLQQVVIACILCFLTCTFVLQFLAAIISAGYPREKFEFIRHFSIFNIVSLICIVGACGFWLWATEVMEGRAKLCGNPRVDVNFHAGFYVCIGSGVFCLIALSVNMICARTAVDRRRRERQRLRLRERNFARLLSRHSVEMTQVRAGQTRSGNANENMLQRALTQGSGQNNNSSSVPPSMVPSALSSANPSTTELNPPTNSEIPSVRIEIPPSDAEFPPSNLDLPQDSNVPESTELPPLDLEILSQEIDILATERPIPPTEGENPPPYAA
jgi:nitrate reductase NapE component